MNNITKLILLLLFATFFQFGYSQTRWQIQTDQSILWKVDTDIPHHDHIEMSGEQVSTVFRYGVNVDGSFSMERSIIWPMLRTIPNDTHASLTQRFGTDFVSGLIVDGMALKSEKVKSLRLNGKLTVISNFSIGDRNTNTIELTRIFFPSTDKPILCEQYVVKNISEHAISVIVPRQKSIYQTDEAKGVEGSYTLIAKVSNSGFYTIAPNDSIIWGVSIAGYKEGQEHIQPDLNRDLQARTELVNNLWSSLVFQSPDTILNTAFAFAKIRGAESIFKTRGGYMHSPGGEAYYAAMWANDQAEYINPFFPFLGYDTGNQSALNTFVHFSRFINDEYNYLPSSVIAEGLEGFGVAGDRGDAAMIAYGAARYALARGDKKEAEIIWPLLEWCLEYCRRKTTKDGIIASDSDELENRFPSGDANLCTSSLYYDALISTAYLCKDLGKPSEIAKNYLAEAKKLKESINTYFGYNVEGFETYRYYEGNEVLRSWICIPLTVGIYERKEGTINALFSPQLWTEDGLLTQAYTDTFWDRSTLYALRGVYAAGEREKATQYMKHYSE